MAEVPNKPTSSPTGSKWRPATPHHSGKLSDFAPSPHSGNEFDFAGAAERDYAAEVSAGGCIGISLTAVLNTLRGVTSAPSLPTSPLSVHEDDGNVFFRFHNLRSALKKTLSCSTDGVNGPSTGRSNESRHASFDFDPFEREKSLMQRAASWGTQETVIGETSSNSPSNNAQVQFHYPPVTSVRLRPRTRSDDINKLFFAPEELDEIEDDRSDTRAADDIETLAVGEAADWDAVPGNASSIVTASYDDQESQSGLMGSSNVMFDQVGSPSKKKSSSNGRRLVRGVQIMLREKSTG